MKRRKMVEAFNLLKEEEGEQFVVKEARWKQLVKLVAPDTSNSHRELLLRISDDEQKGFVGERWGLARSLIIQGAWSWDFGSVMAPEGLTITESVRLEKTSRTESSPENRVPPVIP